MKEEKKGKDFATLFQFDIVAAENMKEKDDNE